MAITKRKLVLTFGTPSNRSVDVVITKPKEGITDPEIKAAMEKMLATGALGDGSVADSIEGAKYVTQQVDEVTIA